jgi:hypothetical protein
MTKIDSGLALALAAIEDRKAEMPRGASCRTADPARRKRSARDASQALAQFMALWNLSREQTVATLVHLRVWLHNLGLNAELKSRPDAAAKGSRVVRHYADWLDSIPEVKQRLPMIVLLGIRVKITGTRMPPQAPLQLRLGGSSPKAPQTLSSTNKRGMENSRDLVKNSGGSWPTQATKEFQRWIKTELSQAHGEP